jgi:hypothetical protein
MQASTIAAVLAVGAMECLAYAAADELLALALSALSSAQHPGYALLLRALRWLLQALFYALLGWQGMTIALLGWGAQDSARGAALAAAVESAAGRALRRGSRGAGGGAAAAPSQPAAAAAAAAAALAADDAPTAAPAAAAAGSQSPSAAYAEARRAAALRERLAPAPAEGALLRFAPCSRDLPGAWAQVLEAQYANACIRPMAAGGGGAVAAGARLPPPPPREADAAAPPGVRAFKRRRTVALVVAEHLTPQLRQGVAYVTGVGFAVPAIVKMVETTWEVPEARWACIVRELCPTDKVSLSWARHRVRALAPFPLPLPLLLLLLLLSLSLALPRSSPPPPTVRTSTLAGVLRVRGAPH